MIMQIDVGHLQFHQFRLLALGYGLQDLVSGILRCHISIPTTNEVYVVEHELNQVWCQPLELLQGARTDLVIGIYQRLQVLNLDVTTYPKALVGDTLEDLGKGFVAHSTLINRKPIDLFTRDVGN